MKLKSKNIVYDINNELRVTRISPLDRKINIKIKKNIATQHSFEEVSPLENKSLLINKAVSNEY